MVPEKPHEDVTIKVIIVLRSKSTPISNDDTILTVFR